MKYGVFKGATMWECYIGKVWATLSFPRYWRYGWPIRIGITLEEM